ncbi:MAG TPA: hypothetical protein VKP30_23445 [Polyangiaceae bacterium]|nr:hypothetical protein [Polyangiaceae bacterium]
MVDNPPQATRTSIFEEIMAFEARNKSLRADYFGSESVTRLAMRDRVLVISDGGSSRIQIVRLLGDAGYVLYEQPSAIGVTRMIVHHGIAAVVIEATRHGLSCDKLIALLRNNPRLEGLLIVVVAAIEGVNQASTLEQEQPDAVVLLDQMESRLVPTLKRLLCTSGFHQKAPSVAPSSGVVQDG